MFANSSFAVVFGVSLTLAKLALVAGLALFFTGLVLFWGLFRHTKGQSRPLSQDELAYILTGPHSPGEQQVYAKAFGARGRAVEFSFNIDSLRQAHKRGDKFVFWGGPAALISVSLGLWTLMFSLSVATQMDWTPFLVVSSFFFLTIGIVAFMAWAAVYTNIDLGADSAKPTATQPPG